MRRPSLFSLVLVCAAGCPAPALDDLTAGNFPPASTSSTATTDTSLDPVLTTDVDPGPATTSGGPGTTSIGSGTTSELPDTTGDPLAPPIIVDHQFGPNPLQAPGPIVVTIATAHADSVVMHLDGGIEASLTLAQPDAFKTEITYQKGALDNGDYTATFIAKRDALESAPLIIPFTVALPAGGSELYWHGDADLGQGAVVALAVSPAHELIELGTYYPNGQARCYLRRRDLGGAWHPLDVIDVMPTTLCTAIDLAADPTGALHVLASRMVNGEFRWWLGKIDTWGAAPTNIGAGAPTDTALALALNPDDNRVAVCGTKQNQLDTDATVWTFTPNQPGNVLSFDYEKDDKPHKFIETPNDCLFVGAHLVLAGNANGRHVENEVERDRHFLLEIDTLTNQATWTVAGPGPGTQSTAQAIAVDANGRYITGGYTCDDQCDPRGELRMFLPGGTQIWQRALDPAVLSPRAIAWSPAEYMVFASARNQGQDTSFFAQAWFPLNGVPYWSYEHMDGPAIHSANALAIGPYGQIYAGGVTAGGYPAVTIIAP